MRKPIPTLLGACLVTAACTTGPHYEQPQLPASAVGEFIASADGIGTSGKLPADWWRLYNDPVLDELVKRALVANTDLRVASANLTRARAIASEARTARFPSTSIDAAAGYTDAAKGGGSSDAGFAGTAEFGVAWEVDLFGRIGSAIAAARADAEAEEAVRDGVRVLLAAETTRAYFNACSYAYAHAIGIRSVEASEQTFKLVSAREQAGSAGGLELERAGSAAARARAALPALASSQQIALLELAALLGTTPGDIPAAAAACVEPPAPAADIPIGDGTGLLRRRPDLREAERRLAASIARIGVATADLYPTISIGGSGSFFRSDAVQGSDSFSFSLGPLLSWNFPNISAARARVRQAEASGDAALARFDGAVLTALKEVEQALSRVDAGQTELAALDEAQARAEKAWEFADLRYRAGSASYLDALVALQDMLETRAAYAESRRRLTSARVDLFKALGGGWQQSQNQEQARPATPVSPTD